MAGEEKTREVFGDYVSIYNFKQSIEDGATVPLYYENHIPQFQLTNDELNDDMEDLLDAAAVNRRRTEAGAGFCQAIRNHHPRRTP